MNTVEDTSVRTKLTRGEVAELQARADAGERSLAQLVRLILRSWLRDARDSEQDGA